MWKILIQVSFFAVLALIAWSDCRRRKIPDRLVWLLLGVGGINALAGFGPGLASGIAGSFAASLPLFFAAMLRPGAFGGGDIKLMAAAGVFLGAEMALQALLVGLLTGGLYGGICLLLGKKGRKEQFAFGPFLCLGIAGAYWGKAVLGRFL